MSSKSLVYVFVQLSSLGYLIISGSFFVENMILRTIEIMAILFGAWAVWLMRNHINIFPELRSNARLLKSGPYSLVRHPMYTVIFTIGLVLLFDQFSFFRLIAFGFLCLSLIAKIIYEEKLLTKAFPAYKEYKNTTKAIIPFIL